jgi:hypothetical protein
MTLMAYIYIHFVRPLFASISFRGMKATYMRGVFADAGGAIPLEAPHTETVVCLRSNRRRVNRIQTPVLRTPPSIRVITYKKIIKI